MSRTVIKSASCNGRVVKLVHDTEAGDWYVREPTDQDVGDCASFDTLAEAEAHYDECVKAWQKEPNWDLQAEYDARWGTDNGYAPWQAAREY